MSVVALVVALFLIGLGLYLLNAYGKVVIDGRALSLINLALVIVMLLLFIYWILYVFGYAGHMPNFHLT